MYNIKKLSNDKTYIRPRQTITDTIQNEEDIEELLKDFEEVDQNVIEYMSLNTLVRYISYDKKTKRELFRFGGLIFKIDREYIVLTGKNGFKFSVQRYVRNDRNEIIYNTRFFKKKKKEYKENNEEEDNNYEEALQKTLTVIDEQTSIIKKQERELEKLRKIIKK